MEYFKNILHIFGIFCIYLEYSEYCAYWEYYKKILSCDLLCCVAEEEEEEVIGADPGISSERARGDPAPAAPDAPITINCVQETLDVRKVMAMAGSMDSFVKISNHLDQIMPGAEPVLGLPFRSKEPENRNFWASL